MTYLLSDWRKQYPSIEELFSDLSIEGQNPSEWINGGWIETNTNSLFIEVYEEFRDRGFVAHVWSVKNARSQILDMLTNSKYVSVPPKII